MARTFFPISNEAFAYLSTAILLCAVLYTIYGVVYRLYLSPIAAFPGPKFAALTFWNEFYYDVYLGGKYTWKIKDYHLRHGK